jgi:hypothetical protein
MRFHRVQCLGLIDRDDLSHERIESNRQDGVYVSPVADIENLFLIPSVARHIYRIVGIEEVFNEIEYSEKVIKWIEDHSENWQVESIKQRITNSYKKEIESLSSNNMMNFIDGVEDFSRTFDPQKILQLFRKDYAQRLLQSKSEKDPIYALEVFRVKSSLHFLSHQVGLKGKTDLESRILGNIGKDERFKNALRMCLPEIRLKGASQFCESRSGGL